MEWSHSPGMPDHRKKSAWPSEPPRRTNCPGEDTERSPNLENKLDGLADLAVAHIPSVTSGFGEPLGSFG